MKWPQLLTLAIWGEREKKEKKKKGKKRRFQSELENSLEDGSLPNNGSRPWRWSFKLAIWCHWEYTLLQGNPWEDCWRAVVPTLKEKLLGNCHGGPLEGYFSGNRLHRMLIHRWWWKGVYKDCVSYCKNCPDCAVVSGSGHPGKPQLQPIPVSRAFQTLGIDILALPKMDWGNHNVLVVQDILMKWPLEFAMPNQKTD